jgi:two-component system phosphate regulon sensor histidine kinase PhoR
MNKTIRLIWQLYPTYLVITLIALGAVSWYAANSLGDFFYQRTRANLHTHGRIAGVMISRHLDPPDPIAVDLLCKQIGQAAPTRITVILPDGKVIGDSEHNPATMDNHIDRPEVLAAVTGNIGSSQRYSRTLDQHMMYVAFPLGTDTGKRAILRAALPLTDIDAELANIQNTIAFGGFLIAIFASLICFYVSLRISRPIERLRKGAQSFADGHLDRRLPIPSTRETAELAKAMNHMAARLEKRLEAEIDQRNEMEAILASMTEGVIAIDLDDHILSFNQAAAEIVTGLTETSKGQGLQVVIRNLQLQNFITRAVEDHLSVSEDIILYQTHQRVVNVHATPMHNSKKTRMGTLLVLNDVTQLRHLEKMRQDFVANVSHEIKTPLTAIKGFVETLQSGAKDQPDEADRFISIIEKHTHRLEAIIEDLLQLSRIEKENEAKQIRFATGFIRNILKSSIQICQAKADARNIDIQLSCPDDLSAAINNALFEQALINLIDNAVKYSGENTQIIVAAEKTATDIAIRIQDKGIGIAKEHIPRLFERFYRVDKARSRNQGGTGLGLAIVKHIITLRAHSKITLHFGSRFILPGCVVKT